MNEKDQEQEVLYEDISPLDLPELVELANKRYAAGVQWANSVAIYNAYERKAEIKFAQIVKRLIKDQAPPQGKKAWTTDEVKYYARAEEEWIKFVKEWDDAHYEMLSAINVKSSIETAFEAIRTQSVNDRELNKKL